MRSYLSVDILKIHENIYLWGLIGVLFLGIYTDFFPTSQLSKKYKSLIRIFPFKMLDNIFVVECIYFQIWVLVDLISVDHANSKRALKLLKKLTGLRIMGVYREICRGRGDLPMLHQP